MSIGALVLPIACTQDNSVLVCKTYPRRVRDKVTCVAFSDSTPRISRDLLASACTPLDQKRKGPYAPRQIAALIGRHDEVSQHILPGPSTLLHAVDGSRVLAFIGIDMKMRLGVLIEESNTPYTVVLTLVYICRMRTSRTRRCHLQYFVSI